MHTIPIDSALIELTQLEAGPQMNQQIVERVFGGVIHGGGGAWGCDYSNDWNAVVAVRDWARELIFSRRRAFTLALQKLVSLRKKLDFDIDGVDLIIFVEPVDICRAALYVAGNGVHGG